MKYFLAFVVLTYGCWQEPGSVDPPTENLESTGPIPEPERNSAVLLSVTDGDTIRIRLGDQLERVRLIGIDTPETASSPRGPEPYAREATQALRTLLDFEPDGPVEIEIDIELDVESRDRYGRLLAYIYVGETFINAEMVRMGWARPLTVAPNVRYAETFFRLAADAREAGVGIWAE